MSRRMRVRGLGLIARSSKLIAILAAAMLLLGCGGDAGDEPLVVYCAHDSVYAEQILDAFEAETGIPLSVRFDTEATKSLGLTELIIREADNPRADVFWNNQLLGTADLAERGLLHPYKGPGWEAIPEGLKAADGSYTGFGARLRVWIVNTEAMEATDVAIQRKLDSPSLDRVAIAVPLYGTTLTHYTVLADELGLEGLKQWHSDWQQRGVIMRGGNATTKNLVAGGTADMGLTDTDDAFVALDAGEPVAMRPVTMPGGQQIVIPNTVAIIKGTDQLDKAQRLVEYLLSAKTELALARSKARQIPLGEVDAAELPEDVRELKAWVTSPYPLQELVGTRQEVLDWLKSEMLE